MRELSPVDRLIGRVDDVLRAATAADLRQRRDSPAAAVPDASLAARDRRRAAGLMRVNHAGEVCAQALYVGQAVLARDDAVAGALMQAAREEGDHLFWCDERLRELDSATSRLNFFWFTGSLAIGMLASAAGDRWSLGFVEETERQVVRHLQSHLDELPQEDARSRAIVEAMRDDEAHHADAAVAAGASALPVLVTKCMSLQARVMTTLAYWI